MLGGPKEPLEGDWQGVHVALIEFPSQERAQAWYHSAAYAPAMAIRHQTASTKMILLPGV